MIHLEQKCFVYIAQILIKIHNIHSLLFGIIMKKNAAFETFKKGLSSLRIKILTTQLRIVPKVVAVAFDIEKICGVERKWRDKNVTKTEIQWIRRLYSKSPVKGIGFLIDIRICLGDKNIRSLSMYSGIHEFITGRTDKSVSFFQWDFIQLLNSFIFVALWSGVS